MKIVLATGIFPPAVGGPAQYAVGLSSALRRAGHTIHVMTYGFERRLPSGLRHLWFFLRLFFVLRRADLLIALDTFSVALPCAWARKFSRPKFLIRTGGDFLWEQYLERRGPVILLRDFYAAHEPFTWKERLIFRWTRFALHAADQIIFSTALQRDIFVSAYGLNQAQTKIVENFYGPVSASSSPALIVREEKITSAAPSEKIFLWVVRPIQFKNRERLLEAFKRAQEARPEIRLEIPDKPFSRQALLERMKEVYAVILPSLTEISPNYILDAVSVGTPFICTQENGINERIVGLGLFIDPMNPEDITKKIVEITDHVIYSQLKERLVQFTFTHSWDQITDEFLKIAGGERGVKILMIGTDRAIFEEGSEVRRRMIEYGKLFDELRIIVFSRRQHGLKEIKISDRVRAYPTNSVSRFLYINDARKLADRLGKEGFQPTVVSSQDPFECGLAAWKIARAVGAKLHLQIHTDPFSTFFSAESLLNRVRVRLARFLISRSAAVRVVSERVRRSLIDLHQRKLLKRLPPITVLPIFVDIEKIKSAPITVNLKEKYSQFDFIALTVGRLTKEKNISLIIRALAEVVRSNPRAGLIIVGDGPERTRLGALAQELKCAQNVRFEGQINELASYYKTSDLFVLASNYEGYGRAVIEAQAADIPVVMTDVGVAGEEIKNDENGLIVPVSDQNALSAALRKLIEKKIILRPTLSKMISKEEYLQKYREGLI
ncbi:MAG: Glycos transf 1 protein [Candidatus Magasanikbacteria bacterium]|nr:Glycos transf 1 protein [Candidatus Magasanikbacteria bacterium]